MPVEDHDWLDSDLSTVLHFEGLSLEVRTQLVNVTTWYQAGCPPADQLIVFTDGSASSASGDIDPCAWAFAVFIISDNRMLLLGHASGQSVPPGTPFFLGEQADDALTAELLALCWAFCWAAQFAPRYATQVSFRYDALSAGGGAFGTSKAVGSAQPSAYTDLAQFAIALRQYTAVRTSLTHRHVPGHSGYLGNELCDGLAKLARKAPRSPFDCCLPTWPARWAAHPLSNWAWATVPGQPDVPRLYCFEAEVQLAQVGPSSRVPAPEFGIQAHTEKAGDIQFSWSCITFNALTLKDKPRGGRPSTSDCAGLRVVGRKDFLKTSLSPHRPLFIGLQETRLPNEEVQPDADYFILNAAATDRGVGGCALWIAKRRPIYVTPEEPVYVQQQDITVIAASHRHLVVALQTPRIRMQVHVIHAPSTYTVPVSDVKDFWDQRAREVLARPDGTDFLILCDANARLGDVVSAHASDYGAETEGEAGALFHSFLATIDAIAPATWECYHHGDHVTWCSATGGWSRIDYVLVPRHWRTAYMESRTLPDVELLQLREDHIPVHLLCRFARALPPVSYSRSSKHVLRPDPRQDREQAIPLLQAIRPEHWTVPVDLHYARLVHAWTHVDQCLRRPPDRVPHQPYISASTLDLVDERKALRLYLRAERHEKARRWSLLVFAAFITHWRGSSLAPAQLQVADRWFRDMDRSEAIALANYRRLARSLRRAVAMDRAAYLDGIAQDVAHHSLRDPKELYRALRKAFPAARSARRASVQPLPMLSLADGSTALTTDMRAEAWRAHFATQEAGTAVSSEEYPQEYARTTVHPRVLDMQLVPALPTIERLILTARRARAAGPDGVSAEFLQLDTPSTARQLMPVFLKAALRVSEPVAFRGGNLICLAKKAGQALGCEAFRSILISSVPGKVLHRSLREALKPLLLASQPEFQAGVAPGQGIEGVALAARSFYTCCYASRTPASLTFFDLQAAFYQVLRQALVPADDGDTTLLRLLHNLRIPPTAIPELVMHLTRVAQLPALGATTHAIALVQDLFRGTWFRLAGFSQLTVTTRGSRPGDPTADLMFGFTLAALLKSVQACLLDADLLPAWPLEHDRPHPVGLNGSVPLGQPSWADDFVVPQTAHTWPALVDRTCQTIGIVVHFATAAGMTIKFGVDKTAILFPPAVAAEAGDSLHCVQDGYAVSLHNDILNSQYEVPAVHSYCHLGGIIASNCNPTPDLHYRYSRAAGTLKPLRKRFFSAREFSLPTRAYILRSLVVSKFAHSAAALLLPAACHVRIWEQHYMQLWRALFPRSAAKGQLHSYRVLHEANAPSPTLALARARASFLSRVFQHGPAALLAVLWDHWVTHPPSSWLAQVAADVDHVSQFLPRVSSVLPRVDVVAALFEAYREDVQWWPRQVKAAEKILAADLETWVSTHRGTHDAVTPPAAITTRPFSCYLCQASFALRKHLHAHLAKTHQVYSPARHYALSNTCSACLRMYPNIKQAQQHLKSSPSCLRRCLYLHPPLTPSQFRTLEAPEVLRAKRVLKGQWKSYQGLQPSARALQVYGPRMPTAAERSDDSPQPPSESDTLLSLAKGFCPSPAHVVWISDYLQERSQEGARATAHRFWLCRPLSHHTRI